MLVFGRNGIVPASCVVSLKINNKVIYTTASELDGIFEMDIPLDEALEVLELYCSKPNFGVEPVVIRQKRVRFYRLGGVSGEDVSA